MSNNNIVTSEELNEAIDSLSKNLYLESPDLWIDFSDKMGDNNFDEMVLFFAIKYNYPAIVKHAIESHLIKLDSPSRNKTFKSIKDHLLSVADQYKNVQIHNILTGKKEELQKEESSNSTHDLISNGDNSYIPKFICPHCNSNIFKSGYIISEEVTYKYSKDSNKTIPISSKTLDNVTCDNCKNTLKEINNDFLQKLSSVQNCISCGLDLTSTGIVDKIKMIYDKDLNKFLPNRTSYHCSNCDQEINDYQKEHFNL